MQVKNLFEPSVKKEILDRINTLTPGTKPLWGKMDVAQMLAHCQKPLGVAIGEHKLKGNLIFRIMGPLFKKQLYNNQPFKRDLPTDKSFIIADPKDFENEKQRLIKMIQSFSETKLSNEPHPFFGKLTPEQWSRGTWKHLDHHLKQFGA